MPLVFKLTPDQWQKYRRKGGMTGLIRIATLDHSSLNEEAMAELTPAGRELAMAAHARIANGSVRDLQPVDARQMFETGACEPVSEEDERKFAEARVAQEKWFQVLRARRRLS